MSEPEAGLGIARNLDLLLLSGEGNSCLTPAASVEMEKHRFPLMDVKEVNTEEGCLTLWIKLKAWGCGTRNL